MRYLLLVLCVFSLSIVTSEAADESGQLLQNRLRAHIEFLADDLMLGRQPGSDGYNIAANYVVSQFQQMGLMPAGNEGSYFQQVPLRQAIQVPGSAELILVQGDETISMEFVEEFYMSPSLSSTSSELEAGMVFAGYGIDAAELDHQDFKNINVEGKVVVTLYGQPHDFPSEEGAHFASTTEKLKAAARHGAVGVLMIHTPRTQQRFQWERVKSIVGTPNMGWINASGEVHGEFKQIKGGAMVRHTAADSLFENAPLDLATLLEKDENGEPLTGFDLEGKIIMRQSATHDHLSSPNVAAILPGSDPLLAGEYVVYTAHLDHIGELPVHDDSTLR